MKLSYSVSLGAALLATAWAQVSSAHPPARFGEITTGKTSLYHTQNGVPRNDLSGTATDGNSIIFVDDGGDAGAGFGFNFVRVTSDLPDDDGYNIPLALAHADAEAATYANGWFYLTTSFDTTAPERSRLTRFHLDAANHQLLDQQSVNLRDGLIAALRTEFGEDWYNSWKDLPGKSGGLNIEGLSAPKTGEDAVVFGLRSPLFGGDFPANLRSGNAILAKVKHPFGDNPQYDFMAVDLDGFGVRGFEWIPAMHSYVVIGGPVEKGNDYGLYQVFPDGSSRALELEGFHQLCRPESVIQQTKNGKDYLVVISEDSGPECAGVPFTFIRAEITRGE
jgi:hypothetical protein